MFDTQLVYGRSDIHLEHADFVEDTRQSTDFSRHRRVVKLREHTVGPGRPVIIVGEGWLDIDLENGSFERAVNFLLKLLMDRNEGFRETLELEDIYYIEQVSESRFVTYPGCRLRQEDIWWHEPLTGGKSAEFESRVFITKYPTETTSSINIDENGYFGLKNSVMYKRLTAIGVGIHYTPEQANFIKARTEFQEWVNETLIPPTKTVFEDDCGSTLAHYYCIRLSPKAFMSDDEVHWQGPTREPLVFGQEVESYKKHGYFAFRQEGMFYRSYLWKNGQPNALPTGKEYIPAYNWSLDWSF